MKDRPITIVLIAPKRNKNSLWSKGFFPTHPPTESMDSFPINAAWAAPKPGRKAVKGEAIIDAKEDLKIDFFDSFFFKIKEIL